MKDYESVWCMAFWSDVFERPRIPVKPCFRNFGLHTQEDMKEFRKEGGPIWECNSILVREKYNPYSCFRKNRIHFEPGMRAQWVAEWAGFA